MGLKKDYYEYKSHLLEYYCAPSFRRLLGIDWKLNVALALRRRCGGGGGRGRGVGLQYNKGGSALRKF